MQIASGIEDFGLDLQFLPVAMSSSSGRSPLHLLQELQHYSIGIQRGEPEEMGCDEMDERFAEFLRHCSPSIVHLVIPPLHRTL
jgi:hypothetical protein